MNTFRRFAAVFLTAVACLAAQPVPAHAASTDGAGKYIESVANQALTIVSNKRFSKDQKQSKLESLFSDSVDFPWVARFVMGRFWRQATEEQKSRYLREYQKFEIRHYTSRFIDYTSGTFKITGARDDGDNEFTISMQIQPGEAPGEPVFVEYRVRKDDKGYRIFDVNIEGVSMIATQRSEFSSVLTNNGIDYLITQLAARAKTDDAGLTP